MCAIYFGAVMGQYGLTFWLPTLLQSAGVKGTLEVGLLTAVPYTASVIAMLWFGRSSDRHRERRWHFAATLFIGAVGLAASALAGSHTFLAVAALTVAAVGVISSTPLFWGLPTSFLSGAAAAAGIGAINSVGNLAGFASPYVVGWLKDLTHSTESGMYVLAAVQVVSGLAVLTIPKALVNK
jgi:MFS family permease